jgi:sec-independent protein translocase protein TatC
VRLRRWFRKESVNPEDEVTPLEIADDGPVKPFVEHLEDLRGALFKILGALFVGFNIALLSANRILAFMTQPLRQVTDHPEKFLQSLNVTDSIVLSMKIALYVGLIISAPAICYFVGQFILPALRPKEKRMMWTAFAWGTLLFLAGCATCFFLIVPQTLRAFIQASRWLGIEPRWTIESYISFISQFVLMCGLTFEIPLVVVVLVRMGFLSYQTVRKGRKVFVALAFTIAAFLAPPDPLSMMLMAAPLVLLFEIAIWLSWFSQRNRKTAHS